SFRGNFDWSLSGTMARFAAVTLLAAAAGTKAAWGPEEEGWPRFRGPNGSGVSETVGLPVAFGPETNVAWKLQVPAGSSSPTVMAGRIFLTGYLENQLLARCIE